jgi:hypothetical protein
MKLKVALGILLWTLTITAAHIHLNIGWARSGAFVKGLFGDVQKELQVGFLPVT